MPVTLPEVLDRYVQAVNARDVAAIGATFAGDATVHDEGRTFGGRAEVDRWIADVTARYGVTMTPLAVERDGPETVVSARVAGSFDGSPVELRYRFALGDEGIAGLRIEAAR